MRPDLHADPSLDLPETERAELTTLLSLVITAARAVEAADQFARDLVQASADRQAAANASGDDARSDAVGFAEHVGIEVGAVLGRMSQAVDGLPQALGGCLRDSGIAWPT